jgi:hypothetical protein
MHFRNLRSLTMPITEDMVRRGVKKATELALLPRTGQIEDIATNDELMLEILQAALNNGPDEQAEADSEGSR